MDGWMAGWLDGRMAGWQDDRMTGWLDGKIVGWQGGRVVEWQDGWMYGWLDDRVVGWQDDWMAGWLDSKCCPRCAGGPQLLRGSHRYSGSFGGQLWLLLEISTTWLLLSNPDIHSSQPLTLVCAPWVRAGWLCVIHFLPPLPPATTQPREPHSPIKEGSH